MSTPARSRSPRQDFQQESPESKEASLTPVVDPDFECDAPQFYDFVAAGLTSSPLTGPAVDGWFDNQKDTPLHERWMTPEPLLNEDGEEDDEDDEEEEEDDDEEIDDMETPRPSKSKSPAVQLKTPTEDKKVEMVRQSLSKFRPFTPKQKSELYQSTTAEHLMLDQEQQLALTDNDATPKPPKKTTVQAQQPVAVKGVSNFIPNRSVKPLTVPVEFKFSNRVRSKPRIQLATTTKSVGMTKNQTGSRAPLSKPIKPVIQKVTKPVPFRFHQLASRAVTKQTAVNRSPYVSLAERLRQVDKTPDRFKRNVDKKVIATKKPAEKASTVHAAKLTRPKSPKFMTNTRIKKTETLSSEERLLREIQTKGTFKARPLDLRVLTSSGDLGVPRIKKAELTVPKSPKILKPAPVDHKEGTPVKPFKAHPFVPPKPFQPKIEHRVLPIPEFRLPGDDISQKKRAMFEAEIAKQKEEQERTAAFKARPVTADIIEEPKIVHSEVQHRPLTVPKTPQLTTKVRGQMHRQVFQEKVQQQMEEERNRAQFKAHGAPHAEPFVPAKSEKHVTENIPFHLHTEERAEERKFFDEEMKKQQELVEQMKMRQQEELRRKELEEVRHLRKQMEFHAHPVKSKVVPFEPQKSSKPLTEPHSPYIGEKRKLLMKK